MIPLDACLYVLRKLLSLVSAVPARFGQATPAETAEVLRGTATVVGYGHRFWFDSTYYGLLSKNVFAITHNVLTNTQHDDAQNVAYE